jgi:hypothetical protein
MPIFTDKSATGLPSLAIEIEKDNALVIRPSNREQSEKILGALVAEYRVHFVNGLDLGYKAESSPSADYLTVKGDLLGAVRVLATYQLVSEELIRELVLYLGKPKSIPTPSERVQSAPSQVGGQDMLPEIVVGQQHPSLFSPPSSKRQTPKNCEKIVQKLLTDIQAATTDLSPQQQALVREGLLEEIPRLFPAPGSPPIPV